MQKYSSHAPLVLRLGLAFVFLWFGATQVINPEPWIGLIPAWITGMGISATTFVYINGIAEIILGAMLVFNIFVKWVAFLLFLHMVSIVIDVGLSGIGVRDIGLAAACLALSLFAWGNTDASTSSQ